MVLNKKVRQTTRFLTSKTKFTHNIEEVLGLYIIYVVTISNHKNYLIMTIHAPFMNAVSVVTQTNDE